MRANMGYVADCFNNRVQVLNPEGRFVTAILGDHQLWRLGREKLMANPDMICQRALAYPHNPGFEQRLEHPNAVKIDRQGRLCVLDHVRGRIQVKGRRQEILRRRKEVQAQTIQRRRQHNRELRELTRPRPAP